MAFQKVEFEFPHEEAERPDRIKVEPSSAVEITLPGRTPAKRAKAQEVEVEVDDDDDYEVEVVDDTPPADRNRKASEPPEDVTEEELQDYSEKVRKRIQHFSKGYHDERRAKEQAIRERVEAEQFAQRIMEENNRLKGDAASTRSALVEQAKKANLAEVEEAKRAYREAYDSGDSEAVLQAQEKLTAAKLRESKLADYKETPLQQNTAPVRTEANNTPSAVQVDPRAESWRQDNPWFGSDDEMTSLAMGLHNSLVKSGVNPNSDDYYQQIDAGMRRRFPERFGDVEEDSRPRKRRPNVVAPATRSTSPTKIRLTQTQVTLAKRLGLKPEQYAQQLLIDRSKQQ